MFGSVTGALYGRCAARLGTLVLFAGLAGAAWGMDAAERRSILDAARPAAARDAGQPVKIKVDVLNVDASWAVLVGELVSPSGGSPDWKKAEQCHPDLDKMLWVVLKKSNGAWKVRHIDICASEPPYWSLDSLYGGLVWPCGVYTGLEDGSEDGPPEKRCRQQRAHRRP